MRFLALAVTLIFLCVVAGANPSWPAKPHYRFQVGGSFGLSKISAALTDFPGSHWGIHARYEKHTFGFRREWDGEFMKMWGEPLYYERIGIYYGWTEVRQHAQWGPQIGFGTVSYNHFAGGYGTSYTLEQSIYGDVAFSVLLNARGTGLGAKVFLNLNRFHVFAGCTVFLQVGFAWNGRSAETDPME